MTMSFDISDQPQDADTPVTVSVARKVLPGHEGEYEEWIKGVTAAASKWPGHMGVSVLRPSPATNHEYVLIYRYDSYAHARVWEESEERASWVTKLDGMTEGEATFTRVTGLEFWFDLPAVPAAVKPSPHKMALVLIVVVFALVYPMQLTLGAAMSDLPLWFKVITIVVLQVLLMTYFVMPRVTHFLKSWLFRT